MKVGLQPLLNDAHVDANQSSSQRQLSISVAAIAHQHDQNLPLNLCLVLDHSGSMHGRPLETVKKAAISLVEQLKPQDRLSIVAFDHRAKVIIPNQFVEDIREVERKIKRLYPDGGTAIDEGLKLGIEEIAKGAPDRVSQILLLTDGENEHGDNQRCLKLSELASKYKITLNTLGFGNHWNQDVLEKIADAAGGTLSYIARPEQAVAEFSRLFERMQSVGLTNAYLSLELMPNIRLAELKPIAQVAPDTIELPLQPEGNPLEIRLGDLMVDTERVILVNLYIGQLSPGVQTIAKIQIRYDDPALGKEDLLSDTIPITAQVQSDYQPAPNDEVKNSILALAKYRQTQIAEAKLQAGDRMGAATMLQTAAQTALQMGDQSAATVLQGSATRLQAGEQLSEGDRKKTRIVSKTTIHE